MDLNDAIRRLNAMASGDGTWDLSENDRKAIAMLIEAYDEAVQELYEMASMDGW